MRKRRSSSWWCPDGAGSTTGITRCGARARRAGPISGPRRVRGRSRRPVSARQRDGDGPPGGGQARCTYPRSSRRRSVGSSRWFCSTAGQSRRSSSSTTGSSHKWSRRFLLLRRIVLGLRICAGRNASHEQHADCVHPPRLASSREPEGVAVSEILVRHAEINRRSSPLSSLLFA
jgi:hypothetical protein